MIKLKQKFIIYAAGLLFLLTGCIQDGFFGNTPEADDDALTFTFTVDGITTNSTTRAAISPVADETAVETLHLLFFNAEDDQSGKLAGVVSLPSTPVDPAEGKLTMETSYVLPTSGTINASTSYHVIGVANLGAYLPENGVNKDNKNHEVSEWLEQWTGVTEAFFRDNATVETEGTDNEADYSTHRPINFSQILMNGYVDKPANTKNIQMVLSRNVARFDLENKADSHALKTISIWNAFIKSSITGDAPFNYSSENLHTKRFYGINTGGDKVTGGLYSFANYSETPTVNDKLTTNLIVGLSKDGTAPTRYYRINVSVSGAYQLLKNNFAYNISIIKVQGDGYPTENEAWEGTTNQLVYVVNNWNLDDNGLIVSDEYSLLAVPVKTVKIAKEGSESSYSITTFSTLENPEPLRIKSQIYDPADGNITARISNGNLIINAGAMNTGQEIRSGIITISYAGLETTVNVLQTAAGNVYLEVTLDSGWKEFLPPTANAMSEFINVKASGAWTARLYGSSNFSFQNELGNYVKQISSIEFTENKFHVYTSSSNDDQTTTQKGFVMVTLDSDPDNYVAVVPVNQASRGGIKVNPLDLSSIRFYGSGKLETTPDMNGLTKDKTHFAFKVEPSGTIAEGNVRLTGKDVDKFGFEFNPVTNIITVWAKEVNPPLPYTATLYVSDNRNGTLLVSLYQGTSQLDVESPPSTKSVPATGGNSDPILISMEGGQWTATIETVTNGSREIKNHYAKLMVVGGGELGTEPTNKNLYVQFPKVYFPNREIPIKAIVTITPVGGDPVEVEVYQDALKAKTMKVWNLRSNRYGAIGNSYFENYTTVIRSLVGTNNIESIADNPGAVYPTGTTYIHVGNYFNTNVNWNALNNFLADEDGIIVFTNDEIGTDSRNRAGQFLTPLGFSGYMTAYSGNRPVLANNLNQSRVGLFLTTNGLYPVSSTNTFQANDVNTYVTGIPNTAVPVVVGQANGIVMAVDPKLGLVYIGECEIFDQTGGTGDNRYKFMNNFIQYVINSAKYGSHFTEMLYKDATIAPMWDESVWGDNRWPFRSN